MQKRLLHAPLGRILSILLLLAGITGHADDQGQSARIEGRIGLVGGQENNLVHMERLNWGLSRSLSALNMQYSLYGGGVLRGSSLLDEQELIPEYQARLRLRARAMTLELISYSQLRNPMQIAQDAYHHKEHLTGLRLTTALGDDGRIGVMLGVRASKIHERELAQQFAHLQVDKDLFGFRVRAAGELDLFQSETSDFDENRAKFALNWNGSPIESMTWSAANSFHTVGDNSYWRVNHRLHYTRSERTEIWAHLRDQNVLFDDTRLNDLSFQTDYQFQWRPGITLHLKAEGEKVKPVEGDPRHHWRAYRTGVSWLKGRSGGIRGALDVGFKESYRFGSGLNTNLELEERFVLMNTRKLRVDLQDNISTEVHLPFNIDEPGVYYDIDHQLRMKVDLNPGQRYQVANTFKLINSFGTDLAFSEDTLRNAVTHNLQFKFLERKLRLSLDHLTIVETGDNSDTRLHINSRASYRLSRITSVNMFSMYRYKSDLYPEYLWLNAFLKWNLRYLDCALELRSQGEAASAFDENLTVWMRFMRQL